MAGNSLNIVDVIKGYLTNDFKNKVSSTMGESRDRTQSGINAAVPSLLRGLDSAASTPDGARRLASAVDSADDGILSNIGAALGKSSFSDLGLGTFQSLLGSGGLSQLSGNIGGTSGLSGKAVSTLIGFLAPVMLAALKKIKVSRGLDAMGLSNLLAGQRDNIVAAMPDEMIEPAEETHRFQRPVAHTRVTETYSNEEAKRRKSSVGWILPLALAGLLGLVWYGATRSSVRAGRDDDRLAQQTARTREHIASIASLKSKYQSVFDEARAQGVHLTSVMAHDGKLVLKGTAPSTEAANKVWDQIKRVNSKMDDIAADIKVDSSLARPMPASKDTGQQHTEPSDNEAAPAALPRADDADMYVVKSGDTLSTISRQFYGDAGSYRRIFDANRSQLQDPDMIEVGQELTIPMN